MCEVSSCSQCGSCVEQWYNRFTASIDGSTPASRNFSEVCSELGYASALCEDAALAIASSVAEEQGAAPNLARRPAAICAILEECSVSDDCRIRSVAGGGLSQFAEDMNFCTLDGTASSDIVGSLEYPTSTGCLGDGNCGAGEFCDTGSSNATVYRCDPEDGRDESTATGICKDLCEQSQFVQRKERILRLYNNTCDPENNGDPCPGRCEEPSEGCIEPSSVTCEIVDGEAQVSPGRSCKGQCLGELDLTLSSARFTNEGDAILVQLGTPADDLQTSCTSLFPSAASQLHDSTCSVDEDDKDMLRISLAGNEEILPGQEIILREDSGLTAFYLSENDQFNSSTVTVNRCTDCVQPIARITGSPTQATKPCNGELSSDIDGVDINGKASTDPSGRPFANVTWMRNLGLGSTCMSTDTLQEDIERANRDMSLTLRLRSTALEDLPVGSMYCVSLRVTSFLGVESEPANHTLMMKGSEEVPVVSMTLDGSYVLPSSGLRLDGDVSVPSVCEGLEVVFKWTCVQRVTTSGTQEACNILQEGSWQDNILAVVSDADLISAGITAGDTLQLKLQARFSGKSDTTEAVQDVLIVGAPLVAAFHESSPEGIVFKTEDALVFDASESFDLSDPNNRNPLRFTFGCTRLFGRGSCFNFTNGFYSGEQNGSTWILDPGRFIDSGPKAWYMISVLVFKGRGSTLRQSLATRFINVRPSFEDFLDFSIVRGCVGVCPSMHQSSRPLSLYLDMDLDVEFLSSITTGKTKAREEEKAKKGQGTKDKHVFERHKWEMNGQVIQERDTLAGGQSTRNISATAITLSPDFLPRSGEISIACTIASSILGGSGTVSTRAMTSVLLVGPPVCTRPGGDCLQLPETTATLPNVRFVAEAVGYTGAEPLHFEFGFMNADGERTVLQPATAESSAVLYAIYGPGVYTVYTISVDRYGGTSEPATGQFTLQTYDPADILSALLSISFSHLASTGDNKAIFGGVDLVAALLSSSSSTGDNQSRRSLQSKQLQDGASEWPLDNLSGIHNRGLKQSNDTEQAISESLNQLEAMLSEEVAGLPEAITALTSIRDLLGSVESLTTGQAVQSGEITKQALAMIDGSRSTTISVSVVQGGLKAAGMAAQTLAGAGIEGTWQISARLVDSLRSARRILARNSPAGVTTFARGDLVSQAVSRNTLTGTTQANIDNLRVSVKGRDNTVEAGIYMPGAGQEFISWCRNDTACSDQGILALYISFLRDSEVFTSATADWPSTVSSGLGFDAQPAVASGIIEVQLDFKPEDAALCDNADEAGCKLALILPVNGDVPSDDRLGACVRLVRNDAAQTFNAEVVEKGISLNSTTVTCNTNSLGRHMLVSYSAPPSPPAQPPGQGTPGMPPPPPRSPSQDIVEGDPETCTGGARAENYIMFDRNFEEMDTDDFRERVRTQYSRNVYSLFPSYFTHDGLRNCPNFVSIELSPGSVVAAFSISLGAGSEEEDAEGLEAELGSLGADAANRLFDEQDLIDSVMEISRDRPSSSSAAPVQTKMSGVMTVVMAICVWFAHWEVVQIQ